MSMHERRSEMRTCESHATEHAGEGSVRMADAGSRVADAM